MTTDIGYLIDARLIRYLRNRTVNHEALYWSEHLGTHFTALHDDAGCAEAVDHTCYRLITTDDAQHLYLKTHDDRASACIFRARIVAVEPDLFMDSRRGERYAMQDNAIVAQEPDEIRRYMRHGRQALNQSPRRRRDSGSSLGRGYPEEPPF